MSRPRQAFYGVTGGIIGALIAAASVFTTTGMAMGVASSLPSPDESGTTTGPTPEPTSASTATQDPGDSGTGGDQGDLGGPDASGGSSPEPTTGPVAPTDPGTPTETGGVDPETPTEPEPEPTVITMTDDDGGQALFALADAVPGERLERCIAVTYTGPVSTPVSTRLYFDGVRDTGLAEYLSVSVTEGSGGRWGDCGGFETTQSLLGATTLTEATASHHDFDSGLVTFTPTASSQTVTYLVTVEVDPETPNSAQGSTAGVSLHWEART